MKIEFRETFTKDLRSIREKSVLRKVDHLILECELANRVYEIKNVKKLSGHGNFFRIRIGDFRIGLFLSGQTLIFVRILHRKDIYKYFP